MKKKVLCDEAEMRSAIINILSERENEADGHGQSLTVNELQRALEDDFEFSGKELGNVLNELNLNGKITVTLKAKGAEEELLVFVDLIYLSPRKEEKISEVATIHDLASFISSIGMRLNPAARGPVVAKIRLWNGRIVQAAYHKGERLPDVMSIEGFIRDKQSLLPFIDKILQGGAFITQTGNDDLVCTLEWQIVTE